MNIFYSELCLIGGDPVESVDRMIAAGAEHVELMLDGEGWDCFHLRMDELVKKLKGKPVSYAVHTPVWDANLASENYHLRRGAVEAYKQTILFASRLGADHVVIHPGFCYAPTFSKKTGRSRANEAIEELLEFNKDCGVRLLMENVGSNKTSLYTMEEFIDVCHKLPQEAGCLIDIGHAHMNGWDLEKLLMGVKENLYALHIHDNDGTRDSHMPLEEGTVDWNRLAEIIKMTNSKPNLILEYNIGTPMEKLTKSKEFLEKILPCNPC